MSSVCQSQIAQWKQSSTYSKDGQLQGYHQGKYLKLADIELLKPHDNHRSYKIERRITEAYGQHLLTDPNQHNPLHFCYIVHGIGTYADLDDMDSEPELHSIQKEDYLRERISRFFHPEESGNCIALCMSMINQDSVNAVAGDVGYLFKPPKSIIAMAAATDLASKNWSEAEIYTRMRKRDESGFPRLQDPELLLETVKNNKAAGVKNNEILAWGKKSAVGKDMHENDLIPIATFSVLKPDGSFICPEKSKWMQKHSEDFGIPHVHFPFRFRPYSLPKETVEGKGTQLEVTLNYDEYRLNTQDTAFPFYPWSNFTFGGVVKIMTAKEMAVIIDFLKQKNYDPAVIVELQKSYQQFDMNSHLLAAPFMQKLNLFSHQRVLEF